MNCPLFQSGRFTLRSGRESLWKIECDAFTKEDWETLALMASQILPPFRKAYGVPRGGIVFAECLGKYATKNQNDPILIAEDVVTTGGSVERYLDQLRTHGDEDRTAFDKVIGVAVYGRGEKWPDWVEVICPLHPKLRKM